MLGKFTNRYKKKKIRFNIILIVIGLLMGVSLFSFIYYKWRNTVELYISVILGRDQTVAYWIAKSIQKGDMEIDFLGRNDAIVEDKESFEMGGNSREVYLLLRIKATRDRRGIYLYRNNPLLVGRVLELKLTKVHTGGLVTYIGFEPPEYKYKKVIVKLKKKGLQPEIAEGIKVGSEIRSDKSRVVAKILDKRVALAEVRTDTNSGQAMVSYDKLTRDVYLTMELLVKHLNGVYLFQDFEKIKVGDQLTLFFSDVSLYKYNVVSVKEVDETKNNKIGNDIP